MKRSLLFYGKIVGVLLMAIVYWGTAICVGAAWLYVQSLDVPDHRPLLVASDKSLCATEGKRQFVALKAVPPIVKAATVAAADPEFYVRPPVNPFIEFVGVGLRAVLSDLFASEPVRPSAKGPHAISMSVAGCLSQSGRYVEKRWLGVDRQLVRGVLLYRIERDIPKDRILEIYLNETWLGVDVRGFAAASEVYFGKQLPELSVAETAFLAAMPRAPSNFLRNKNYALIWRDRAIDRMAEAGAISAAEAEEAKRQPLPL